MRRIIVVIAIVLPIALCAISLSQEKRDTTETESRKHSIVIPDPDDKLSLAMLAANSSVAFDLGLTVGQSEALRKALKESNGNLNGTLVFHGSDRLPSKDERADMYRRIREKNGALVDELLPPASWSRLRELAYQVEVSRLGMGESLTNGRLGQNVGVFENQKQHLNDVATRIEAKASKEIVLILERAQQEILQELSPEQRDRAEKLLGKPFHFRDDEFRAGKTLR